MLRKCKGGEFEQYIDFIYGIAMDLTRTSFPVYCDGVKTKDDFVSRSREGLESESEEILLYEQNDIVEGWIHYYVIEEDLYIGTVSISIRKGYTQALRELMAYWNERFPGYEWNIYFPEENREALAFMEARGHICAEKEIVDVLLFDKYVRREQNQNVVPVTKENFALFRQLHSSLDDKMYWSTDRIWKTIDMWGIYAFVEGGYCRGALYYTGKGGKNPEIFGIDTDNGVCAPKVIEALLTVCLNEEKRQGAQSMYFFNDEETHRITERLGFSRVTAACFFDGRCALP